MTRLRRHGSNGCGQRCRSWSPARFDAFTRSLDALPGHERTGGGGYLNGGVACREVTRARHRSIYGTAALWCACECDISTSIGRCPRRSSEVAPIGRRFLGSNLTSLPSAHAVQRVTQTHSTPASACGPGRDIISTNRLYAPCALEHLTNVHTVEDVGSLSWRIHNSSG